MHTSNRVAKPNGNNLLCGLLAAALITSGLLLVVHFSETSRPDCQVLAELLLVGVLSVEGLVALCHLRQSRLAGVHEVLVTILHDFRSPEMLLAINSLWRFRREHGDDFVNAYLHRWRQDDERIAALPEQDQLAAMAATLHQKRRIVKEFYNLLAGLWELGVFPKEVLCTYWNEAELRIIPEILIPLESTVAKELRMESEPGGWLRRLRHLYESVRCRCGNGDNQSGESSRH